MTWLYSAAPGMTIFKRLRQAGLTAKPVKCELGMQTCTHLGHIVGNGVVKPETSKLLALESCAVPQTKKQVRAFLGLTGYYRKFISSYAEIAAPLTELTRKMLLI